MYIYICVCILEYKANIDCLQVVKTPANTQHWAYSTGFPVLAYSRRIFVLPVHLLGLVPES